MPRATCTHSRSSNTSTSPNASRLSLKGLLWGAGQKAKLYSSRTTSAAGSLLELRACAMAGRTGWTGCAGGRRTSPPCSSSSGRAARRFSARWPRSTLGAECPGRFKRCLVFKLFFRAFRCFFFVCCRAVQEHGVLRARKSGWTGWQPLCSTEHTAAPARKVRRARAMQVGSRAGAGGAGAERRRRRALRRAPAARAPCRGAARVLRR